MNYPVTRMRRLRANENIRRMVRETSLSVNDLIYPLFCCPGEKVKNEINSMPGNYQMSPDMIVEECKEVKDLGIPAIILFGIPEQKDPFGSDSYSEDGIIQTTLRAIKESVTDLIVITDICMCEYTDHGHCGIIKNKDVDNDETLKYLARQALSHVSCGADMVAPSDMMDGRVGAIRDILDENNYTNTPIMAYSAKYASAFYGPFREAAESAPQFGDRKSYQMDTANVNEAIREIELDIIEGADIVMVKPALAYLDVIYRAKQEFSMPLAAYNVSGEFSLIQAAAKMGWIDKERIMLEVLHSIKRAGADIILTYFAKDVANLINK